MADKYNIYKKCERCEGDGTIESRGEGEGDIECPRCSGTGEILWGEMREEE